LFILFHTIVNKKTKQNLILSSLFLCFFLYHCTLHTSFRKITHANEPSRSPSPSSLDLVLIRFKQRKFEDFLKVVNGIKDMKFYISAKGIKRVTISNGKGSGKDTTTTAGGGSPTVSGSSGRRISLRTVLPVVLVLGILLPFVFVRVAILVLESATFCSSLGNSHSITFLYRAVTG